MNKEEKEKWIIDLLNEGASIRRIAKKLKVPHTTLSYQIHHNKKYELAWNRYKTRLEGMFK